MRDNKNLNKKYDQKLKFEFHFISPFLIVFFQLRFLISSFLNRLLNCFNLSTFLWFGRLNNKIK